jgi:hypothetical protein
MLKRAATHIKKLSTPFFNDITGAVSGISNALSGQQVSSQEGKVAAELLKKSPFEVNDSPQEKMKRDPLSFSQIQYPLDLTDEQLGHYIIFYSLKNKFSGKNNKDFAVAQKMGFATDKGGKQAGPHGTAGSINDIRKQTGNFKEVKTDNSVLSKLPTHTQVTSAIALYMPAGTKVSYGANYEAEATNMAGQIARTIGNARTASDKTQMAMEIAKGAATSVGDFGKKALGELGNAIGAGDPVQLVSKAFGVAINPNEEQFYSGPSFREFTYAFDFHPRSQKELEAVQNIIFLFKYHMHPDLDLGITGGRLFKVPSEFEIHYAHLGGPNEYMNKISKCALKAMDVNFGPEAQFSAFEDGAPVSYKMSLTFQELELMTKQKIYEGH